MRCVGTTAHLRLALWAGVSFLHTPAAFVVQPRSRGVQLASLCATPDELDACMKAQNRRIAMPDQQGLAELAKQCCADEVWGQASVLEDHIDRFLEGGVSEDWLKEDSSPHPNPTMVGRLSGQQRLAPDRACNTCLRKKAWMFLIFNRTDCCRHTKQ